jgi:anti-sigma factor RsiW
MSDVDHNPNTGADAASVELFDFYVAQLEAYLDGELDAGEASQVRRRLMQEDAYAAALGRLHAQRIQRIEIYKHIEHDETDEQAAARIAAAARRIALKEQAPVGGGGSWPTWTKVVFGMAACLLVGFGAGLVGVYDIGEPPAAVQSNPVPEVMMSDGWHQVVNGEVRLSVPEDAEPMDLDENGLTPLLMPDDRTTSDIPK